MTTAVAVWKKGSIVQYVLQEISGTYIEATCIVSDDNLVLQATKT